VQRYARRDHWLDFTYWLFYAKAGGGWIGNNNVTVTSVTIVSDT
jgi:hypothetical protein